MYILQLSIHQPFLTCIGLLHIFEILTLPSQCMKFVSSSHQQTCDIVNHQIRDKKVVPLKDIAYLPLADELRELLDEHASVGTNVCLSL